MLTIEKLLLSQIKSTNDQVLILTGMTWSDFEQLTNEEYLGYRTSYKDGEIIIVSPGRNHENTKGLTGDLIIAFCDAVAIDYYHFGSTTLKNIPEAGKEPDDSYAIGTDKDLPDIAIEVNYSSGNINSLEIYLALGIKEVWLWDKNDKLSFYILESNKYIQKARSSILLSLESATVEKFVKLMKQNNPRVIKQQFIKKIKESDKSN